MKIIKSILIMLMIYGIIIAFAFISISHGSELKCVPPPIYDPIPMYIPPQYQSSDGLKCVPPNNFSHIVCSNCFFEFFIPRVATKSPHELLSLICAYCGHELKISKEKIDE